MALIVDGTPEIALALLAETARNMIFVVIIGHIFRQGQPGENLHRGLSPNVEGAVNIGIEIEKTVVVINTPRQIITQTARRAGDGDIVRMGEHGFLIQGIVIIGVSVIGVVPISIHGRRDGIAFAFTQAEIVHPSRRKRLALVDARGSRLVVIEIGLVKNFGIDIAVIHNIRDCRRLKDGDIAGVGDRKFFLGAGGVFGGDENHTEGSPGTVDGRSRRVLQDGHALDIVGVEHIRLPFHAVDEHQRASTAADGGGATDIEIRRLSGFAVLQVDVQVGNGALQHLRGVRHRPSGKNLFRYLVDRAGQVLFLDRAVTDDHRLLQKLRGGLQQDFLEAHPGFDGQQGAVIAQGSDFQLGTDRGGKGEVAIQVRDGAVGAAFDQHGCVQHGLARRGIQHLPLDLDPILRLQDSGQAQRHQSD